MEAYGGWRITAKEALSRIARRLDIHSHSSDSETLNAMYCRLGTVLDAAKCPSLPASFSNLLYNAEQSIQAVRIAQQAYNKYYCRDIISESGKDKVKPSAAGT